MAELMKLIEANGAFKSDLMQSYLSSVHGRDSSLFSANLTSTSALVQQHTGVNLNLNQSAVTSQGFPVSSVNFSSRSEYSTESTTGNNNFGDNMNGNSVCVPSTRFVNDNLPSIISLDNMNTSSLPNLNELNKLNLTSPGTRSNINTTNINAGATADTTDNLNANAPSVKHVTDDAQKKLEPTGARPSAPDTNANNTIDIAQIISEVRERLADSRQQLIDQVTGEIVDAHMNTTINTFANVQAANERIQRETIDMPDMSSLSINGSNLWQHFMGAMLPEITKVIKFCTKLPGFAEIDQEDKVTLIKHGCFEVMVARFCILIDHVKEEMLDPTLQMKAPRNVVQSMPMGPFLDQFFNVANQFNPLGLNDGEIGLFTAILIISPERQGLKNQKAVTVLQQLFIQSLYLMLKNSHQDAELTVTSLMNLVPVFHKINEDHLKFLKMIKMKSPAEFEKKFPALHKELFDTC
ncbi:hypothetical protein BsWGS_28186 [Bradybaena similaris]